MKYVLSALAAITLLVGVGAAQPAEARCYCNGWSRNCWSHAQERWHHHYYHHYWHHDW